MRLRSLAAACTAIAAILPAGVARADPVSTEEPVYEVEKRSNVVVPMSDGTRLVADVHLPKAAPGTRFPCLLEITAYRKETRATEGAGHFAPRGFAFVEVDLRGTGGSEGRFDGIHAAQEQRDGAEAVEWVAAQPWCNGKVGMFGGSWTGGNQYLVAAQRPPHLAAIAPQRAVTSDFYRDVWYVGGMLSLSFGATWGGLTQGFNAVGADPTSGPDPELAAQALIDHTTTASPIYGKYAEEPYDGPMYHEASIVDRFERIDVPVFHVEGWYDAFLNGQLRAFTSLLALERAGRVRGPNHMIIGPWAHSDTHALAHEETAARLLGWYRHFLDGVPRPAWMRGDRLTYFEQHEARDGAGAWRTSPRGRRPARPTSGGTCTPAGCWRAGGRRRVRRRRATSSIRRPG